MLKVLETNGCTEQEDAVLQVADGQYHQIAEHELMYLTAQS